TAARGTNDRSTTHARTLAPDRGARFVVEKLDPIPNHVRHFDAPPPISCRLYTANSPSHLLEAPPAVRPSRPRRYSRRPRSCTYRTCGSMPGPCTIGLCGGIRPEAPPWAGRRYTG